MSHDLDSVSQNIMTYINQQQVQQPLLSSQQQQQAAKLYLHQYFSPWDQAINRSKVLADAQKVMDTLTKLEPMILKNLPALNQKAISVRSTNIRVLPRTKPYFESDQPGEGYPFDLLQVEYLPANTPIVILATSENGDWALIHTARVTGWVQTSDVAQVSTSFARAWETKPFVAVTRSKNKLIRIGTIHPLVKEDKQNFYILTTFTGKSGYAETKTIKVSKKFAKRFPLLITPTNIAHIGDQFMGQPYDWGGAYGYRDCSSTIMDLLAPFGIWLPRNSSQQMEVGQYYSLKNLSNHAKIEMIREKGLPLLTIIHKPGHVMLYLGMLNGEPYVLQTVWGLHTYRPFRSTGRAIIGKTVITPLNFGQHFVNVTESFVSAADSMAVLS